MNVDELLTDLTEEKQVKQRKKTKRIMPPKEIVPIKCADKVGMERWTPDRKDLANFPSPARILLLGGVNSGKSTMIKNLILHARPRFEEVFLVHQDAFHSREYEDLECTAVFDDVPPLDFWSYEGKYRKRACIIDDLEITSANKERLKNLAIMWRYASSHKGLTIYFAHQSFFDVPPLLKKLSDVFVLWKPRGRNEMQMIENRVGLAKGTLNELFTTIATKHRDSICIDLKENSPAKLRLNIWSPIELKEDE